MKKIISLALGVVAMAVVSGCNTTTDGTSPRECNEAGKTCDPNQGIGQVNIDDLGDGYIISGYDKQGDDVSLYFCNENYVAKRKPNDSNGTFTKESYGDNSDKYNIKFNQEQPKKGGIRLYTHITNGIIKKCETYKYQNTYSQKITITKISQDDSEANYACK